MEWKIKYKDRLRTVRIEGILSSRLNHDDIVRISTFPFVSLRTTILFSLEDFYRYYVALTSRRIKKFRVL